MTHKDTTHSREPKKTSRLQDISEELESYGIKLDKPNTKPLMGESRLKRQQTIHCEIPSVGAEFTFEMSDMDCIRIGRNDTRISDEPEIDLGDHGVASRGISRRHAIICREQSVLTVRDLKSTNGTYLNGQKLVPLESRVLRNGDELLIGYLEMKVHFD